MRPLIDHNKFCLAAKRLLFISTRYPAFRDEFIELHIDRKSTSATTSATSFELKQFEANSTSSGRFGRALVVLIFTIYSIKNFVVAGIMLKMIDHHNLESNLKPLAGNGTTELVLPNSWSSQANNLIWTFSCLSTNCSYLSKNNELGHDLSKLPLFSICFPNLSGYYTPVTSLDSLAILAFSLSAYGALLLGSWPSILQSLFPASSEFIMFIVAPKVTTELMRDRARELLCDMSISLRNFYTNPLRKHRAAKTLNLTADLDMLKWKSSTRRPASLAIEPQEAGGGQRGPRRHCSCSLAWAQQQMLDSNRPLALRGSPQFDQRLELLVDDCLPIIRTHWWRHQAARSFTFITLSSITFILFIGSAAFGFLYYRLTSKRRLLVDYSQTMAAASCSIWRTREQFQYLAQDSQLLEPLQLDQLELTWTLRPMLETALLNFVPGLSVIVLFAYYDGLISDAACWLSELKFYLLATLAVFDLEMLLQRKSLPISEQLSHQSRSGRVFRVSSLKRQFIREVRFLTNILMADVEQVGAASELGDSSGISASLLNSRSVDRTRYDRVWTDLLGTPRRRRPNDEDLSSEVPCGDVGIRSSIGEQMARNQKAKLESLDVIYVNFRLFFDFIHSYTPSVLVLISITYLLVYGLVIIAVFLTHQIKDFKTEPMFTIAFAWLVSYFLLLLASNFHAKVSSSSSSEIDDDSSQAASKLSVAAKQSVQTTPTTCLVAHREANLRRGAQGATPAPPLAQTGPEARLRGRHCADGLQDQNHLCQHNPGELVVAGSGYQPIDLILRAAAPADRPAIHFLRRKPAGGWNCHSSGYCITTALTGFMMNGHRKAEAEVGSCPSRGADGA